VTQCKSLKALQTPGLTPAQRLLTCFSTSLPAEYTHAALAKNFNRNEMPIMLERPYRMNPRFQRRLCLALIALAIGVGGVSGTGRAIAQNVRSDATPKGFETISIRPVPEDSLGVLSAPGGVGFRAEAMPLSVQMAFGMNPNQMVMPEWTQGTKFDIVAKQATKVVYA